MTTNDTKKIAWSHPIPRDQFNDASKKHNARSHCGLPGLCGCWDDGGRDAGKFVQAELQRLRALAEDVREIWAAWQSYKAMSMRDRTAAALRFRLQLGDRLAKFDRESERAAEDR